MAEGPTIFPGSSRGVSHKAEAGVAVTPSQKLPVPKPLREAVATYTQVAGIEAGYGYFAPNVPGGYRLVFELHYSIRRSCCTLFRKHHADF